MEITDAQAEATTPLAERLASGPAAGLIAISSAAVVPIKLKIAGTLGMH